MFKKEKISYEEGMQLMKDAGIGFYAGRWCGNISS
jgi:hypothetical protein